jgi:hypothetical protein
MYIYCAASALLSPSGGGGALMERNGSRFTLWHTVKNTASTCQNCNIILDDLA